MGIKHLSEKLKHKAENVYDDTKAKLEDELNEEKDMIETIVEQVKETINDLYEGSKQKVSEAEGKMHEYTDELVSVAKEKPITTLLIAGGIGLVILGLLKKFK